jgi:hypothetical protein
MDAVTLSGGAKLDAALREMAREISKPATLRVGFLSKAKYPDGTSVALVAAVNEYGRPDKGQPPRPFFRNMIADKSPEWPGAIAGLLKDNGYNAERALELTGSAIAGQLRQSIIDLVSPPLAESTIRRKGFDKPLIDTGHMLQSVDYEVKTG